MSDTQLRSHPAHVPPGGGDDATCFITWRLRETQAGLSREERDLIVGALRHFDQERYCLWAFVVMDDHVHVLLRRFRAFPVERIVHSWKSYSTHILQKRGRHGSVWARGYSHRLVRNESEYEEKLAAIRTNPQRRWPSVTSYPWMWYHTDA